jgi:anti-sigma B factor antagonist
VDPISNIDVRDDDGVIVARLDGEVDLSNARQLGDKLTSAVPNAALGVVIDLSGTTYLDSSGVHLMFELAERLGSRQQQLRVAVPAAAPLRRVLTVVDLESAIPIAASVEEAAADMRNAG